MNIPDNAIGLAKRFEGLSLRPYICPAGYPTIGYGHVIASVAHKEITKEEAEILLENDLLVAMSAVLRICPILATEPPNRLAAIIDFTFNLGAGRLRASTLRLKINAKDWEGAGKELLKWIHGGGRVLPGLVKRRLAELELL